MDYSTAVKRTYKDETLKKNIEVLHCGEYRA